MSKKKTFKEAKKEISEKYYYLELLEFNGNSNKAKFLDKDYGEFIKTYCNVLRGNSGHPDRGKKNRLIIRKKTMLEKYGYEHASQITQFKTKIKDTNLERYGVENPQQNEKVKEKSRKTNLKRYGTESVLQNKDVRDKIKKTNLERYGDECAIASESIQNKIKKTNLNNYGVEFLLSSKKIQNKIKETNLKKYGVKNVFQSEEIKEKIKNTNLEKYGANKPIQNEEIKKKIKETNLERYGVENPQQNRKINNKTIQTKINKGQYYAIDGYSLKEYYRKSNLSNQRSYSCIQQNYKKNGNEALDKKYYDLNYGKSNIANIWLNIIEYILGYTLVRNPEYHIPGTSYHADGYDPKTNTIYEFYGDYWHGYPFKYLGINKHKDTSFNTLFYKTLEREEVIVSMGYNLCYIWENDFNKMIL